MNQKLQNILDIIQQSEKLDVEQKNNLTKAVKDADKELEITSFKLERTEKVKKTTAILLEETIKELEQKRKAVEAQNRELEIEASLERVRAIAMSMMKSEDLLSICEIFFKEFNKLGFNNLRNSLINIFNDEEESFVNYDYSDYMGGSISNVSYNSNPANDEFLIKIRKANDAFVETVIDRNKLDEWKEFRRSHGEKDDPRLDNVNALYYYNYSIGSGSIGISNFNPISEEQQLILKRFRNVFNLSYQRYADIAQAEAQAREAKIEAALEKVRAVAMSMQKAEGLLEVVEILNIELRTLGFTDIRNTIINIFNDTKENFINYDYSDYGVGGISEVDYYSHPVNKKFVNKMREASTDFMITEFTGNELDEWKKWRSDQGQMPDSKLDQTESLYYYEYSIGVGSIGISTFSPISEDQLKVLKRFRNVFKLSYQRYVDITLAEAQAKEAQIELALERVRARTMGMQRSEELKEVIQVVYEQFVHLNIHIEHTGFIMDYKASDDMHIWLADRHDVPFEVTIPYFDCAHWNSFIEAKEKGIDFFANHLTFEEKNRFYQDLFKLIPGVPKETLEYYFSCPGLAISTVLLENVGLYIENFSGIPYTDEENNTLMRFGKVFQQTYTRFNDLIQAEAQAREAQIEAALEKVRSRTMAMQKSDELAETAYVLYEQFGLLGENPEQLTIGIIDETHKMWEFWLTLGGNQINHVFKASIDEPMVLNKSYIAWKERKKSIVIDISGDELKAYYNFFKNLPGYKEFNDFKNNQKPEQRRVINIAFFSNGSLSLSSPEPKPTETIQLLERFASVLEQTYTRFLDLQKAEAQAREAQIENALEKVRSRTMAMQKSEELSETAKVFFEQMHTLGELPDRIGINIIKEDEKLFEIWATNQDGSNLDHRFRATIEEPTSYSKLYAAWKANKDYIIIDLKGQELKKWLKFVREKIKMTVDDKNIKGRRIHNATFFSNGVLLCTTHEPVKDEVIKLLVRFAKVFDQTYRRFLDLQKAEAQAREAQIEGALERVRSKTMAMHNSNDVGDTVVTLFDEVLKLGLDKSIRCGIGILEGNEGMETWSATSHPNGKVDLKMGMLDMTIHPMLIGLKKAWESGETSYSYDYIGDDVFRYYEALNNEPKYPFHVDLDTLPENIFHNSFFYSEGILFAFTENPVSEEAAKVLNRFAGVFGQTYRRYLDLQKAEAQAREAQIEAALERVRARTMAMHKSDELADTAAHLFGRLKELGINPYRCNIGIVDAESDKCQLWSTTNKGDVIPLGTFIPLTETPSFINIYAAWKKKLPHSMMKLVGKDRLEMIKYFIQFMPYAEFKPEEMTLEKISQVTSIFNIFNFEQGFINIHTNTEVSEPNINVIERFTKVFEQTYTRFLDLKKAEAQAREAQIEAALERVRSKTLAMHNSHDVGVTVVTLFDEVLKLDIDKSIRCGICIFEGTEQMNTWSATSYPNGEVDLKMGMLDMTIHPLLAGGKKAWKSGKTGFTYELTGEDVKIYYDALNNEPDYPLHVELDTLPEKMIHNSFFFSEGSLFAFTEDPVSEEAAKVLNRFAGVFGQTYRRYLDLQKAESQAREAQIEAALERVRSRTMAMHKSDELAETAGVLFEQFVSLGITPKRCSIGTINQKTNSADFWMTTSVGKLIPGNDIVPLTEEKHLIDLYDAWQSKKTHYNFTIQGEERANWTSYIMDKVKMHLPEYQPDTIDREQILNEPAVFNCLLFSHGFIMLHTAEELNEKDLPALKRFATVFDGTYTRFLDLKRAEAQAREAKIEASLERVRSKAMSMHSPNDLSETVNVFFKELKTLGIIPIRCGVGQVDEATRTTSLTTTTSSQQGNSFQVIGKIKQTGHPVLDGIFENWKLQKEYHPVLQGEDIKAYYNAMNAQIAYPEYPENATQYGNNFPFKEGFVFAWTESKLSEEELQIFRRFTSVLSLTYRRYIDLKSAEVRAFEAVKQASLDRVRAEIASMRTSEDLNRITPIIWRELKTLEVPFFRCGVFIVDEGKAKVQVYLTTPDGKSLGVLNLSFDSNELTSKTVEYWRKKKVYKEHWNKEEFISWSKSMLELGQIQNTETYQGSANPPKSLYLHFVPFAQGMLYVGDTSSLSEEKIDLVKSLAESFSIAYGRYEDFDRLETAKKEVESAFGELDLLSKELKIKNEELETENQRKALELEEARQLQLSMLPKELPKLPNLDIAVYMKTATEVGGDYYDFKVDTSGTLTVAVGDATGHGMKAGTIVSMIKALFASGGSRTDMKSFFNQSSDALKRIELGRLMMAFIMLKIKSNKLEFANAGMPPLFIYRKHSGSVEEIMINGMPLGAIKDFPYKIREMEISSGDTILLLSDGLPELKNVKDENYSYNRVKDEFKSVAEKSPDDIVSYLKNSAADWVNGVEPDDDVTFVIIKIR